MANNVTAPAGQTLTEFAIQLLDTGTGINDNTVTAADVTVYRSDNPTTPLIQGQDYFYSYDTNNHIIYLAAGTGVWAGGYTYTIHDSTPIRRTFRTWPATTWPPTAPTARPTLP